MKSLGVFRNRYWQLIVGLGISMLFIYWALPGLHLPDVIEALRTANYWWLDPRHRRLHARTLGANLALAVHAAPGEEGSPRSSFPMVCIGYFGNNVFPFRAGELLRSYVLKQAEDIPIPTSLATVIVERLCDGLVMLLFVFLALPFAPMPDVYRNAVIGTTTIFLIVTVAFIALGEPAGAV